MKKIFLNVLTVIVLATFIVSCSSSDDDNNSSNNNSVEVITSIAEEGNWRITYFYDTDHEETSNFTGYSFTFNNDGNLVAENGNNTVTGTWSVSEGSSSSSSDDDHFNIFFAAPDDFEDLSDDWDIISTSTTKIELIDVSGGNGGTDYLTFEKN